MSSSNVHPTDLTSLPHLSTLLKTHTLLVIDFHATWCGPCHAIAPFYTSLAAKHSSKNHIVFTKCDVDAQSAIARQYSVTAMPTFIVLHKGVEIGRVRGADRAGLAREVEKGVKLAGVRGGMGAAGGGGGHVLGGGEKLGSGGASVGGKLPTKIPPPAYIRGGTAMASVPLDTRVKEWFAWVVWLVVLYFTSLFSLDPLGACEGKEWNGNTGQVWRALGFGGGSGGGGGGGGGGPPPRGPGGGGGGGGRKLGTMDTIPGSGRTVGGGVNMNTCG